MDLAVSLSKIDLIISSYISGKKKEALLDEYDKLSNIIADTKFYLAIVGEFSSGKSTFINALLRKRLLKEAVKPTTVAATFIEKKESEENQAAGAALGGAGGVVAGNTVEEKKRE